MQPGQLIASLEAVRKRAKSLSVLYGLALLILGASGLIVLGALADYLLRLPGIPRLIGLVLAGVVSAYVFWEFVWKPARARLTLQDVAGRLEETFPQFNDRLRSSVQFLGEREVLSADPLRRRTVEQAGEIARKLDFEDVLITRPAYTAVGGAMAVVLALAAVAFLLGPVTQTIIGRLFDPLNPAHQWPKRFVIAPVDLEDRVPAGKQVAVNIQLAKGRSDRVDPVVYYQLDEGPVRQLLMTRQTDGSFSAGVETRLPAEQSQGALKIWVEAGDDSTAPQTVQIVPRLVLTSAAATIIPPPYVESGRMIETDLTEGPAVAGVGSQISLRLSFNKALAAQDPIKLEPVGDSAPAELTWQRESPGEVTASFTAQQTLRFNVAATDRDGFVGDLPQTFEVVVRPDQSPLVQIESPRRNESRTPVAVVPLVAVADDDFGFREIALVVRRLGDNGFEQIIPLYGQEAPEGVRALPIGDAPDRVRLRISHDWDLSQLPQLAPGDVLEYFVRAQDNFELEGTYHEPVESGKLRITIISQEELNQRVVTELRNVKDQVAIGKAAQDRNKRETTELAEQSRDKTELDEADRAASRRLSRQQSAVAATTKRLSDRMAEIEQMLQENRSTAQDLLELTGDVTQALEETAEEPMKSAAAQLEQSANEATKSERAREAISESQANQEDASERLRQAIDQMERIGSLRSTIDQVSSLLQEQKELGERAAQLARRTTGQTPEQMGAEDRQENQDLTDQQQELSDRTQEALQQMQRLAEEMEETDPASSESLERAAQTGQQQQVPQQQQQAAQAQQQNQQSQAQQRRQQAEIGLEMMLNELKEAERRKLEELQRKLAEMQEQVERLVRRQAGHNLDNRTLSGEDVKTDPWAELRELAGIEGDDPVEPSLPRLSSAQEQTERNTRDISRAAEDLPEGSVIADLLTRASARMERAAVFLRQKDLTASYEPPQVEALTALQDALAAVDEQKAQVEEELENQQRETIRARLQSIRDEQVASVNQPTLEIQGKKDEGNFRRPDQIKLNSLPGAQQTLNERVTALTEDLANVGGIAFVYANKQIEGAMAGVHGRLAESDTSRPTQIEQERIVSGLDAMIEALKITPREQRFDENSQAGAGGGQGQQQQDQGPQLPPESELKLVKALQEGVNRATKELAQLKQEAAGQADDPLNGRIVSTGDQQGELRGVLDQMLRQYSQGRIGFGPEPDPADQLPEEAGEGDVEDRELIDDLLGGNAGGNADGGDAMRVGDRMARSRQRLALNQDPGKTTQIIQERIVVDIDSLIRQSQQQQQQQQASARQQRRQQRQQQQQQQAQNQGENQQGQQPQPGTEAAQASRDTSPGGAVDASADLLESMAEWGKLTPRQRAAILESKDEQVIDRYRQLIEAYWKSLNQKRTDPRR